MRTVIATQNAPQAIGPYSQAIQANGFIFVSGQIPLDPATHKLSRAGWPCRPSGCSPTWKRF